MQFGSITFQGHSDAALAQNPIIAPLWSNIGTDGTGNDIFVDTSTAGQVTIRWNATNATDGSAVDFSATLFSGGQIRFDYGPANTNLSPTIGISSGNGRAYVLSSYDGRSVLTGAASVQFSLATGFRDVGAYEFRGSSLDTTPVTIVSTLPASIQSSGSAIAISQIQLTVSEPLNDIDASAAANYQLIGAGPDGQFNTPDDVRYTLVPSYVSGSTLVTLRITAASSLAGAALPWTGALPPGQYQLTVFSNPAGASIHDLSGLQLDGDGDDVPGGNYVRTFTALPGGSITGRVYNDANDNGNLDAGEQGLVGWTVYIDSNNNGVLDAGEVTAVTDSNGVYTFNNLQPGTYVVRGVNQNGYAVTSPLGYSASVPVSGPRSVAGPVFGNVLLSSARINFNTLVALARSYGKHGTLLRQARHVRAGRHEWRRPGQLHGPGDSGTAITGRC